MQRVLGAASLVAAMFGAAALCAQIGELSGERMRAHVRFLASDLLEGRGVGQRGGDLATEYIATQFALIGAKPAGDNGTYFQNFKLVGVDPQPTAQLNFAAASGPATSASARIRPAASGFPRGFSALTVTLAGSTASPRGAADATGTAGVTTARRSWL